MPSALLLSIHFHDGRYHGVGPWPPEPARVFQALVAGAATGSVISENARSALEWLEKLDPPIIVAPAARIGQICKKYVPNNDLDVAKIEDIRQPKQERPRLFDENIPLLYWWHIVEEQESKARTITELADQIYQLGRGVDMAWATGEILSLEKAEQRSGIHGSIVHEPSNKQGRGELFCCPTLGSLESLIDRHKKSQDRFKTNEKSHNSQTFSQPPKPRFVQVPYDSPVERVLYDLREISGGMKFHAWPLYQAGQLVQMVRDRSVEKLQNTYEKAGQQDKMALVERIFIGRNSTDADKAARIRIVPLPSIGHHLTNPSIRRILIEIPPNSPLPHGDIAWAFEGLGIIDQTDSETGEITSDTRLVKAEDHGMLRHYGIELREPRRHWRTVTPAVLPESRGRRRTGPDLRKNKDGSERQKNEKRRHDAVRAALRHAGIKALPIDVHVQREPFTVKGARAEDFALGTRFSRHQLWHVRITFDKPCLGPIMIGNGRYMGLGLMAPEPYLNMNDTGPEPCLDSSRVAVFPIAPKSSVAVADTTNFLHAVRRALMSLSRDHRGKVPILFSGHEIAGGPARSNNHKHIFLAAEDTDGNGKIDRLIVAAPWACDRTNPARPSEDNAIRFDRVISSIQQVRAGRLGVILLGHPSNFIPYDPLEGPAQEWESHTSYRPTRHASRGKDPKEAVMQDIIKECERRGLPQPDVSVLRLESGPKGGKLVARLRLSFAVAVRGPLMLGRDSHMGGGLFSAVRKP